MLALVLLGVLCLAQGTVHGLSADELRQFWTSEFAEPINDLVAEVTVDTGEEHHTIASNGIPDHAIDVEVLKSPITSALNEFRIPTDPEEVDTPGCLPMGAIGISVNGIPIYSRLHRPTIQMSYDLDECNGQTDRRGRYHYHGIPSCLLGRNGFNQTLLGVAFDGFPIYGPTNEDGEVLTSSDLDICHGRYGADGSYRYHALDVFENVVGCFRGLTLTPVSYGRMGGRGRRHFSSMCAYDCNLSDDMLGTEEYTLCTEAVSGPGEGGPRYRWRDDDDDDADDEGRGLRPRHHRGRGPGFRPRPRHRGDRPRGRPGRRHPGWRPRGEWLAERWAGVGVSDVDVDEAGVIDAVQADIEQATDHVDSIQDEIESVLGDQTELEWFDNIPWDELEADWSEYATPWRTVAADDAGVVTAWDRYIEEEDNTEDNEILVRSGRRAFRISEDGYQRDGVDIDEESRRGKRRRNRKNNNNDDDEPLEEIDITIELMEEDTEEAEEEEETDRKERKRGKGRGDHERIPGTGRWNRTRTWPMRHGRHNRTTEDDFRPRQEWRSIMEEYDINMKEAKKIWRQRLKANHTELLEREEGRRRGGRRGHIRLNSDQDDGDIETLDDLNDIGTGGRKGGRRGRKGDKRLSEDSVDIDVDVDEYEGETVDTAEKEPRRGRGRGQGRKGARPRANGRGRLQDEDEEGRVLDLAEE